MATITITFDSDETRTGSTLIASALATELKKIGYKVDIDFKPVTRKKLSPERIEEVNVMYYKPPFKFKEILEIKADIIIVPE